jgi:hypothetical protein
MIITKRPFTEEKRTTVRVEKGNRQSVSFPKGIGTHHPNATTNTAQSN